MEYQVWLKEGLIAAVILLVAFMAGHFFLPLIIRLFESIARKTPTEEELVLKTPEPKAYFVSFSDAALNMRLIAYVPRYSDAFTAQDRLNSMIHKEFANQGVNIPFPTRTVHLTKEG